MNWLYLKKKIFFFPNLSSTLYNIYILINNINIYLIINNQSLILKLLCFFNALNLINIL